MFPFLSDLINYFLGTNWVLPFPMFGAMVAIAFMSAYKVFVVEMKRKEVDGLLSPETITVVKGEKASLTELISNAVFGFVLGFKGLAMVLDYSQMAADPQGFILSAKGSVIGGVIGAAILGYLRYREAEKDRLPEPKKVQEIMHPYQHVGSMTFIAAVGGMLGAKIFDMIENLPRLIEDPINVIISGSGFSIYGGLILGGISVSFYAYKKGLKLLHVIDACAPGLMLSYGVGRIGCQLSGDGDWGMPNPSAMPDFLSFLPDWMWSFTYPGNVSQAGIPIPGCEGQYCYELEVGAWPTPFYEVIMALIIFGILWSIRKKITIPGVMFSTYLIFNGIERFFIEIIRINPRYNVFGAELSQAQIIALAYVVVGVGAIFFAYKAHQNKQTTVE